MRYKANHFSIQEFTIHQKRHIWYSVVVILCCLVVFCTAYALIYPALTMSKDCELIEHTHTSELCYSYQKPEAVSIICTDEAMGVHKHTDECNNDNDELICGYADFVVHSHNELCFDDNDELICTIPELKEHIHEDACYTKVDNEDPILVCKEQEVTLHTHTEDCFDDKKLVICGKTEVLEHIHTEACRQISVGEEELILTCTQQEHTHTPECSSKKTTETTTEITTEAATTQPAPLYAVQPASEALGTLKATGSCNNDITWSLYEDGTLIISGSGVVPNYSESNIPWLAHKDSITKLIVEEGITQLGDYAFSNCSNLSSLELPDSLNKIGLYTFVRCKGLTQIDLSDTSLTFIDKHSFDSCSNLTTFVFPECMEHIGGAAFENCTGLTTINFPDNLTQIDLYTFANCTSLTDIDLSNTKIKDITEASFALCSGLKNICLPKSLETIGNSAFSGCTSLTSIDLSSTELITVGASAFQNCSSLAEVHLPKSLKYIYNRAFISCTGLTNIDVSNSNLLVLDNRAFAGCTALTDVDISNTQLTAIGDYAFDGCTNLYSVKLPTVLTSIGQYAFYCCSNLTDIDLSQTGLTFIGLHGFDSCSSLTNVVLPECIDYLDGAAFMSCTGLTSINFPDNLRVIERYAFCNSGLVSVDLSNTKITELYAAAFDSCSNLEYVKLPDNISTLSNHVLSNCPKLTSVDLSNTKITNLGNYMFEGCTSLTTIIFPECLEAIGDAAFSSCTSLTSMDLTPFNLTYLGASSFAKCSDLTSIDLPDTLETLGGSAFHACSKLKVVDLSNTKVKAIKARTFYNSGVTTLKLPPTLESLENEAFFWCSISSLDFSNTNLKNISSRAFLGCGIDDLYLPSTVESIGESMFSGDHITLQAANLSDVNSKAFADAKIHTLIIGEQVDDLYSSFMVAANAHAVKFTGPNEFTYHGSDYTVLNFDRFITLTDGATYIVNENGVISDPSSTIENTNISWIVKDGVLTISGTGDIPNYTLDTPAPWDAFAADVAKIVIEDGITAIGDYAFKDYEVLTDITIPNSVTVIGNNSFENCSDLDEITLPKSLTTIGDYAFKNCTDLNEANIPQSITFIGKGAFYSCISLTDVNIENTSVKIGNDAFYNCTALSKVNSLDSLDAVMEAFGLADKIIFYKTILWNNHHGESSQVTNAFTTEDSSGRDITLSTTQAGKTLLTGEPADTTLTIDKGDSDQIDYIRIYFAFSGNGYIDLPEGDYTLDNGMEISVRRSDSPNIWFVEVKPLKAGDTLSLTLRSLYSNIITSGGTLDVWMNVLSEAECKALENRVTTPEETHRVTWVTKAAVFPVEKLASGNKPIMGDGSADGNITVNNLSYTVNMIKGNQGTSLGQDHMLYAEFTDRLNLPENFVWTDGLIDAIETKRYFWDGQYLYVDVNGEDQTLCSFNAYSATTYAWPSVEEDGNGNQTVLIHWIYKNSNAGMEIANQSITITFGNKVICVKDMDVLLEEFSKAGANTQIYKFHNEINCTQHFTYSDPQIQTSSCEANVAVNYASFSVKMSGGNAMYLGDAADYTITLTNNGSFPYASLRRVEVPLMNYFYIHPEQMQTLFDAERDGPLLTITVNNAVLYDEIIHENVKDINGNDYIITQQDMGTDTPHEYVPDTTADVPYIRSSSATLSITWAEDQSHLVLTVDANDGTTASTYSIGEGCDFATIQDALDGVGYLTTSTDIYTCTWDMSEEVLYSGETRTIPLPMCAKNSLMLLTGDQSAFITDTTNFQKSVSNSVFAYYNAGKPNDAVSANTVKRNLVRDFTLAKGVYNIKEPGANITEAEAGDVLQYYIDLNYSSTTSGAYNGAPVVDQISGAQILLVSVEDNPHLEEFNLEIYTVNDQDYFILNKIGTYYNVTIGGFLADHVEIKKSDLGLSTTIFWYLSSAQNYDVFYYALVDLEKASMNLSDANALTFALNNEVWLNDHQTHRLYAQVGVSGTRLFIHKYIVENFPKEELSIKGGKYSEHNADADSLLDRSTVHSGEAVTYRLHLDGRGTNNVVVNGSIMYDALPETINNYWSKENIQLFYTVGKGSTATFTCTDGSEWFVDTDSEGKQYIRWNEDFKTTMNGDVYIYVTLTYPTGQDWTDYAHNYGNTGLRNSFHVAQLLDEVFHDLGVTGKAVLQKGVLYTGNYKETVFKESSYTKHTEDTALFTYANDGYNKEVVTYYVALYNSGETRLYLSDIQDVLPKGFSYIGIKKLAGHPSSAEHTSIYKDFINVTDANGEPVDFKSAYVQTSSSTASDGTKILSFNITNTREDHNLLYDEELEMYYLNSNEAIVFAYHCATNKYTNTEDMAINHAAMPIFDYNGAGVAVDSDSTIDRLQTENLLSNSGTRDLYDNQYAASLHMNTDDFDGFTKWLGSEVRLRRGNIVPGITKTSDNAFSYVSDTIDWTIKATNDGNTAMTSYTLTDVMMSPYQFIGEVNYRITNLSGNESTCKLFEFKERSADGTSVTITSPRESVTLALTGEPQPIKSNLIFNNTSVEITPVVSLKIDENGNEILSIEFTENDYLHTGISQGCVGTLTLSTTNNGSSLKNKTYINTAYITPKQEYERKMVTRGSNALLEGAPSVISEANVAVSYGYATAANKSVTEVNTSNTAQSTSTTNFIVLTDKTNTFRYDLTVNNTGGSTTSKAMDMLVLIDNLPEVGDHFTFYEDLERYSEFDIKFADDPQVVVTVNDEALDKSRYTIEYSSATTFTNADWSGLESETQWSSECSDNMRSIRMVIKDDTGETIPAEANITISFNAKVASPDTVLPTQISWNNFGYRYSLTDTEAELEATPSKVGVKIASIPTLYKNLIDSNGDDYPAVEDENSKFLIYRQKAQEFSSFDIATVTEKLTSKNIPFTIVDITVNEGSNESETINLDSLKVWKLNEGGELIETTTNWIWSDLESYTIVELTPENSIYVFGALNDVRPNNYTFTYQAALPTSLSGTNIRNLWSLQLLKQDVNNQKPLEGSVFALYSKLESNKISTDNYEALSSEYGLTPDKTVTTTAEGGLITTWYLMEVKSSNAQGEILWANLTEKEYYVVELKAPNGYKLNPEGELVEATESGTGIKRVIVTNSPGYKLPITGGFGTTGVYILGILMLGFAAALLPILRRKTSSQN